MALYNLIEMHLDTKEAAIAPSHNKSEDCLLIQICRIHIYLVLYSSTQKKPFLFLFNRVLSFNKDSSEPQTVNIFYSQLHFMFSFIIYSVLMST